MSLLFCDAILLLTLFLHLLLDPAVNIAASNTTVCCTTAVLGNEMLQYIASKLQYPIN